jgi:hypothetical protein
MHTPLTPFLRLVPDGLHGLLVLIALAVGSTNFARAQISLPVALSVSTVPVVRAEFDADFYTLDFTTAGPATNAPQAYQNEKWDSGRWNVAGILSFNFSGVGKATITGDSSISACSTIDANGNFTLAGYGYLLANTSHYVALLGIGKFIIADDGTSLWQAVLNGPTGLPTGSVNSAYTGITPDGNTAVGYYHDSQFHTRPLVVRPSPLTLDEQFPFEVGSPPEPDITVASLAQDADPLWGNGSFGSDTADQDLVRLTSAGLSSPYVLTNLGKFPGSIGTYAAGGSADGLHEVGEFLDTSLNTHAFEYSDAGGFLDLGAGAAAGSLYGQAYQCSSDGSVVVGFGASGLYGYSWTAAGGIKPLYPLSGLFSSVSQCMSSDGEFFGGASYDASFNNPVAQIWTSGGDTYNLQQLLSVATVNLSNWHLTQVTAIVKNSDGSYLFAGNGTHNGTAEGWVLQISINPTVIASQPQNQTGLAGGQANFSIQTNTTGPFTYTWERSDDSGTSWQVLHDQAPYAGTTTNSLAISPLTTAMNGQIYRCVCGFERSFVAPQTEASNAAKLAVPSIQAVSNFDGVGGSDILWSNTLTGDRYVWLMNGGTVTSSVFLGTVAPQWTATLGDFNGDGKADILWSNTSSGDRYLWLMNGGTVTSSVFLATISPQWTVLVGDFDSDGKADILWSHTSSGDRYLWNMNGGTVTASTFLGTVAPVWTAVLSDFNGDGKADILWSNASSGDRYVWTMNGGTVTASIYLGNVAPLWTATLGDFDGDGKADILWSNASSGDRYVWTMSGGTVTASTYLGNVAPLWAATLGDFDGDGKADIIWSNNTTGDRYFWQMNGSAVTSSVFLGTVDPVWQITQ